MQCYNYYALFSLPGLSFPLKLSILRSSDLSRNVYEKVIYQNYSEMGIAILFPKVSQIFEGLVQVYNSPSVAMRPSVCAVVALFVYTLMT